MYIHPFTHSLNQTINSYLVEARVVASILATGPMPIKYELTYKTAKRNDAKVCVVGDDWQTIYSFSGSRIEYIYRFKEFFKGAKSFKISRTYRNSQELIDSSGEFIMKNDDQLKKQLV